MSDGGDSGAGGCEPIGDASKFKCGGMQKVYARASISPLEGPTATLQVARSRYAAD